jgi:Na+/proline symporter
MENSGVIELLLILCIGFPMFALFIGSIFWAYQDAEKRGKPGCLVALLVFLATWPVGLIIWLLIRPGDKY